MGRFIDGMLVTISASLSIFFLVQDDIRLTPLGIPFLLAFGLLCWKVGVEEEK